MSSMQVIPEPAELSEIRKLDPGPFPARIARRAFLGPAGDPPWARPLLWALLVGTAVFYVVDISRSGYANDFYAAAVKSGTQNWKAWLFGSLDSGNAITVDKPPASLWVMGLSARLFGFSSASMLVPQALMGVGTVALVYAAVKRWSGPATGLVAGALVTLTPVAALMFRFNNPDALLVLLMVAAAYCVVRAIEASAARPGGRRIILSRPLTWLLLAGTAIGFAFLTKMLQGLLVLPGFALAYLWAAPSRLRTRIWHLVAAMGAVIVSAGWFVLLVALWPAGSRPYIGGSTDNSLWELAIGYNGLSRIFGAAGSAAPGGSGGGGFGGGSTFGGATGLTRMFGALFGSQISWLIPAALIALLAGLGITSRAPRTDLTRAALLVWGGWLVVTGLVFSYMQGIVHPYYSVALAPAVAALVAIGGRELWCGRSKPLFRAVLASMIAVTALWSAYLMRHDAPDWAPWLRWTTLIGGLAGAVVLAASAARLQRLAAVGLIAGSVTALGGMAGWAAVTVAAPHTGSTPTAGPGSGTRGGFGPGGVGGAGFGGGRGFGGRPGFGGPPGFGPPGFGTGSTGGDGTPGDAVGRTVASLLEATNTRWAAATLGSQSADRYILSTGKAVMAIGGFSGTDPAPTLAQFQAYVRAGQISYFIAGGRRGGPGGGSSDIGSWVQQNYPATTVNNTTVYDLRSTTK